MALVDDIPLPTPMGEWLQQRMPAAVLHRSAGQPLGERGGQFAGASNFWQPLGDLLVTCTVDSPNMLNIGNLELCIHVVSVTPTGLCIAYSHINVAK
jgi:hypothetical protein